MIISKANSKLVKLIKVEEFANVKKAHIVSWGLPAIETCPGAEFCKYICYALQGPYRFKGSKRVRATNYVSSCLSTFAHGMICTIREYGKIKIFRIHDSGDFYSQEYIDAWRKIVNTFPDIIFYAYTKSVRSDFSGFGDNFRLTYSEGGKWDSEIPADAPNARIFPDAESREAAGYIDGDASDAPAIRGDKNIGFIYHGGRKLTLAQIEHLVK